MSQLDIELAQGKGNLVNDALASLGITRPSSEKLDLLNKSKLKSLIEGQAIALFNLLSGKATPVSLRKDEVISQVSLQNGINRLKVAYRQLLDLEVLTADTIFPTDNDFATMFYRHIQDSSLEIVHKFNRHTDPSDIDIFRNAQRYAELAIQEVDFQYIHGLETPVVVLEESKSNS